MFQSPICFQCFVPVRCDHWVRGRSYLSSPQQAALQAAGHANLETGCLAGKTVLMDTGLGCPKSFFSLTAFRGRLWKHHNSSSKTSLAATCLWYPFNSSSEHLRSRKCLQNFSWVYRTSSHFIWSVVQDQVRLLKTQKVHTLCMWMSDTAAIFLVSFYLKTQCPVCLKPIWVWTTCAEIFHVESKLQADLYICLGAAEEQFHCFQEWHLGKYIKTIKKKINNFWQSYWQLVILMIFGEWIKFDKQINAFIVGYKPLETHGFPSL